MAHARSTIRAAIVAALKAAGTPAGTRVYTEERIVELADADLPAIRVATLDEAAITGSTLAGRASRRLHRTITLSIAWVSKTASGYVDAADAACAQIETALATLDHAAVKDVQIQRTQFDLDATAEKPLYTAAITIEASYITTQGDPATTL